LLQYAIEPREIPVQFRPMLRGEISLPEICPIVCRILLSMVHRGDATPIGSGMVVLLHKFDDIVNYELPHEATSAASTPK
jgi:hypothetical protein